MAGEDGGERGESTRWER
uniref:Uncharacterized protein n=1 Tax=Arundo donax TaxID=35708 RepID=A0A0A9G6S0_ARUDO